MSEPVFDRERLFEEELLPLYRELIRNACVNDGTPDSGQEVRSVESLERYLGACGIACTRFEARPGRVSMLAEIGDADPELPTLCYMGHTDVVPARAEDWEHPPFAAEIHDGEVWGRGALDMLCWTASQAVATAALHRSGARLPLRLKYLALADEESSGVWGARYLTERHWDRVRCDLMITELGGYHLRTDQGTHALVTVAEKGVCWLKLCWKGTAAHGSLPYRSDNALLKAAQAAVTLSRWRPTPTEDRVYVEMAAAFLENGRRSLDALEPGLAAFLHTAGHTTLSPDVLHAGTKANLVPDRAELVVDIRFLGADCPSRTPADVIDLVRRVLGPELSEQCVFEVLDFFPPTETALDHPALKTIEHLVREYHPGVRLLPSRIGGVTDGRFWRQRGVPVLGFALFDPELRIQDYARRIHAANERLSLTSLRRCLDFFLDFPFRWAEQ